MGAPSFRGEDYGEYRAYLLRLNSDNSDTVSRLKRNLRRAISEELTPRQQEMLVLYYAQQKNMVEIAKELNVAPSTVSRTIKRGCDRLRRCLRYGAKELLFPEE